MSSSSNVDETFDMFYGRIFTLFDKFVPVHKNFAHRYPPWYNSDLIGNIKLKAKYTDCRDHKQVDIGNTTDINFSPINETEVLATIKKLKNKMTSGPDDIPSFIVRDCSEAITGPLAIFFNNCLKVKIFPALWKVAKMCPILKSGNKCHTENFRAMSLLCNFSKVEIVIYHCIYLDSLKIVLLLPICSHLHLTGSG